VWLETNGFHGSGILKTIDELTALPESADAVVLIDMPIGLKETCPHERQCDRAARKLLKKRGSSIVPAPCRQSLQAMDYPSASAVNYSVTGRRLSWQTYHIMPKIRELDGFIRGAGLRLEIREFHPELGFLALNRFVPLTFSKKTLSGSGQIRSCFSRAAIPARAALLRHLPCSNRSVFFQLLFDEPPHPRLWLKNTVMPLTQDIRFQFQEPVHGSAVIGQV
jgi:predicted RNase H-like nuclease